MVILGLQLLINFLLLLGILLLPQNVLFDFAFALSSVDRRMRRSPIFGVSRMPKLRAPSAQYRFPSEARFRSCFKIIRDALMDSGMSRQ